MKVAIDISPLKSAHQFRGIGAYTKNLVKALQSFKRADFELVLVEEGEIPQDCDLIHYSYFDLFFMTLPLMRKKKTVVTIHDTTPLVFPEHYPPGIKGKLKFRAQKLALRTASGVITDSKNSKKDITKYLDYSKEKIHVVYLAAADIFKPITSHQSLVTVKQKYHLPSKFVLYVGDVNYNKNIRGLVKACEKAKIPLVIVGKQAVERKIDRSHPENRDLVWLQDYCKSSIILTGFVPDKDLVVLYNLATVYCQPSFYEGFGLPVLEAMACGTPVVTSKKASLPEIAGKAAVFVDPYDINDIANGLTVVIEDEDLREDLIEKGLKQAKKFSWEKVANETYKVYQEIITKK
ncbi:glycosyltransferase family 4 protein [Patescibacteria group bacterium]|nr:glycosyltransferase family 4 protein [Patescibacteria group bacterium]